MKTLSERRRNRRRPCECRAELTKYAAARPLFALRAGRMAASGIICRGNRGAPPGGNDFWGNPQEGVIVFPGVGTPRISFVRTQARSIKQTAPIVVIQSPSFPSGFPPPRGIGDIPRIMRDKRWFPTHAYRGALSCFKRRALLAEIPAWGEEFGARALCPCLLSVSSALGTQRARRDFQAAVFKHAPNKGGRAARACARGGVRHKR